jgi:hypothetical protein
MFMSTIKTSLLAAALLTPAALSATPAALLGWNNLGMHCMDSDYSVFSVLPPYNTIESQLIVNGRLVTNGSGYTVTYQAIADPDGSFNSTAMGKGNYYQFAQALYGASLSPEGGLAGWSMPGLGNTPQTMLFETTNRPAPGVATRVNWFRAEGIPISPYDDAHNKNPYPLMRLIARNGSVPIATNDVVLPVSDEMDCRACHASGAGNAARPAAGWVWDGLPERDFRLNILRLHDEHQFSQHAALYIAALAARGFNPAGLYRGVVADGKPVLCAACHASEALGAPSYGTIPPLTASVHGSHAHVMDPVLNVTLDNSANRDACYRCHPGSTTRCLRGAMGSAIASDGTMQMQCQSCHGNMSQVGAASRVGWFMEPNCQSCHSGTATANSGQIRYTSVFTDANGTVRVPANTTFATTPNTPAPGISLYRFSAGHGGLQCEACHGSTHAEFPASHRNDNLGTIAIQGHGGMMIECTACHTTMPNTGNGGPHGMHAIGQGWISGSGGVTKHADRIKSLGGVASCQPCHGTNYQGTVLSRAQADQSFTVPSDTGTYSVTFFRGATIGCYNCHNGLDTSDRNPSTPPSVANVNASTSNDKAVTIPLPVTGTGASLRIISQPANGSAGLSNTTATYFPSPGFVGIDTFTFAAYDGSKNSGLGTATITVTQGPFSLGATAHVPPTSPAMWPAAFAVVPTITNSTAPAAFDWDFGDGTPHDSRQYTTHAYALAGSFAWKVLSSTTVQGITRTVTNTGIILVGGPVTLAASRSGDSVTVSWPNTLADSLLETTSTLGPQAQWTWITNTPAAVGGVQTVTLPATGNQFFRVRQPW